MKILETAISQSNLKRVPLKVEPFKNKTWLSYSSELKLYFKLARKEKQAKGYLGPYQTSVMEHFWKNG